VTEGRRAIARAVLAVGLMLGCRGPSTRSSSSSSLAFAKPIIELSPALHERQTREVSLVGRLAATAHLAIERVEDPALEVVVVAREGERAAGLRLEFTGDRVGVRTGRVAVTTGLDEPARLTLLYTLRVRGNVEVTPSNPYFNLRDPGARERVLTVRGRNLEFRVRAVRVLAGPFRATVASDGSGDGAAAIRVGIDTAAITAEQQRGFLGRLQILGNDPAEPATEVPLFAMGTLPHSGARADAGGREPGPSATR
jgi:hypothetical protein